MKDNALKAGMHDYYRTHSRKMTVDGIPGDKDLGPLKWLPGEWKTADRGWNMIALPFQTAPGQGFNYRLLMNHFAETLTFSFVDKGVPNRGINLPGSGPDPDQFVVTLDYEQKIHQLAAADFPVSGKAGKPELAIHHEPGLMLWMIDEVENDLDIARLGSIPHGDSVLALGRHRTFPGPPTIPAESGLPIGVNTDLANPYMEPYRVFVDAPFKGAITDNGFPGFNPATPNDLLTAALGGVRVNRTTELHFDSTLESGGIHNIPFVVRQANAAEMRSTFWIEELDGIDCNGDPLLQLQYTQTVLLDFFPRRDDPTKLIRWPHISINTLEKVVTPRKRS